MQLIWPGVGNHRQWLPVASEAWLPILAAIGSQPGPTLVVSAGVHGDEFAAIQAVYETFEELDGLSLKGRLLALPVTNPPAHRVGSRLSPVDRLDLGQSFPGDEEGTISQQIAFAVTQEFLSKADCYLDLHSTGGFDARPDMIGFDANDPAGRAAAQIFGTSVMWADTGLLPGQAGVVVRERDVPFLYAYSDSSALLKQGIRNVLIHLGILEGTVTRAPEQRRLFGSSNAADGIQASANGFFVSNVSVLDRVETGQLLGRLLDLQGRMIEEYRASRRATIGMSRRMAAVDSGNTVFLLVDEQRSST